MTEATQSLIEERDRLRRQVRSQARELAALRARLALAERAALTDALTGLPNRRQFQERAEQAVAAARRYGHPCALLLIDVDHFKAVNDAAGHAAGDAVLRRVASVLRDGVRKPDVAARYGGEEFAVLCLASGEAEAAVLAERLRAAVARPSGGRDVTISVGVAAVARADHTVEALVERADRALYAAKRAGRDRVCRASEVEAAVPAGTGPPTRSPSPLGGPGPPSRPPARPVSPPDAPCRQQEERPHAATSLDLRLPHHVRPPRPTRCAGRPATGPAGPRLPPAARGAAPPAGQ